MVVPATRDFSRIAVIKQILRKARSHLRDEHTDAPRACARDNPQVPVHCRMRGFDRDLIRGRHYWPGALCAALTDPMKWRQQDKLPAIPTWRSFNVADNRRP